MAMSTGEFWRRPSTPRGSSRHSRCWPRGAIGIGRDRVQSISSSAPEPYIIFAEQDGYTLYESYQLVESQVERLDSQGQLIEITQTDAVPDGRLYLKDPEGQVKLITTHDSFGPSFFAEGGAFSADGQTVYTVAVKNQSQEGIYAIDLKTLNASLILSSSEMGFELIDGTTLEASRSGELGFKAYQAQEVPIAREGNPESTPFELTDQFYLLELAGKRTKMPVPLGPRPGAGLEPEYHFAPLSARQQALPFLLEMPYKASGEVRIACGYNCGKHTSHDTYALDFNNTSGGDSDKGDPVTPALSGSVYLTVKDTGKAGYGNHIILKHQQNYWTLYAHLDSCDPSVLPKPPSPPPPKPPTLECGAKPAKGEVITVSAVDEIGKVGNTGVDVGQAHLHFVVRSGEKWEGSDSTPPVSMNGIGPYMERGQPILPVYPKDDPFRPGPVYPYGDIPRPDGNRPNDTDPSSPGPGDDWNGHRAVIPCTPIVEFFQDAQTCEDGVSPEDCNALVRKAAPTPDWDDRYYMTVSLFQVLQGNCGLYVRVMGKENYPPYPPELGFPIHPSDNRTGVWIEHQSCQIYGEEGKPPLIVRPPSKCTP